MKPLEALAHKLEVAEEKTSLGGFAAMPGPPKPIGLRFNFIEVCGGAAKVSAEVSKRGWAVGPCIDLDRSEHYNLASIEVHPYGRVRPAGRPLCPATMHDIQPRSAPSCQVL